VIGKLVICLHGVCLFVCLFVCCVVCSCIIIICVEEILGIKHVTLRGRGGWGLVGIRNVHFVICIS